MGAAIITFDPFVDDIRAVYHFRWDEFKYDVWGRGSIEMGWSSYTGELTLILKAGQKIFVLEVSQIYWAFRRRKKPSSNLVDYSALCRKTTQLSMIIMIMWKEYYMNNTRDITQTYSKFVILFTKVCFIFKIFLLLRLNRNINSNFLYAQVYM